MSSFCIFENAFLYDFKITNNFQTAFYFEKLILPEPYSNLQLEYLLMKGT